MQLADNDVRGWTIAGISLAVGVAALLSAPARAEAADPPTYTKDIAPILQRSCQNCHRSDGVAPMALTTYEEVRPWARAIKQRTGIGPRAGVMPPWYIEKNIGIQEFKNDPSLSAEEIAEIANWADSGAPRGNPADMPPPKVYADRNAWAIGTPDLIVKTTEIEVKARRARLVGRDSARADWPHRRPLRHGARGERSQRRGQQGQRARHRRRPLRLPPHDLGNPRDRRPAPDREANPLSSVLFDEGVTPWPVHEVGPERRFLRPDSARLLKAGSSLVSDSVHLHSNGRDTKAHLEIGFKFAPKDYKPKFRTAFVAPRQRRRHRHRRR